MSDGEKRIVVIGSGVGGAGVAALLQGRGHRVTLLEKNDFYGGKCWTFERNGFVVDSGVHMFSMGESGQHGDLNRRVKGDLGWHVANPSEHLLIGGDLFFSLYQNLLDPRGALVNSRLALKMLAERRKRDRNPAVVGARGESRPSDGLTTVPNLASRSPSRRASCRNRCDVLASCSPPGPPSSLAPRTGSG